MKTRMLTVKVTKLQLKKTEASHPCFLAQRDVGMFDRVTAASLCVCVDVCVCVCVFAQCVVHSPECIWVGPCNGLNTCRWRSREGTEAWAVWRWHAVTARLKGTARPVGGNALAVLCICLCVCVFSPSAFLYCTYRRRWVVWVCSQGEWTLRCFSDACLCLASVKGPLRSLLFPHWQNTHWQGLPSLHPNKERWRRGGGGGGGGGGAEGKRHQPVERWLAIERSEGEKVESIARHLTEMCFHYADFLYCQLEFLSSAATR